MDFIQNFIEYYMRQEIALYDPCVIAYLIDNEIFKGKKLCSSRRKYDLTRGETVIGLVGSQKT